LAAEGVVALRGHRVADSVGIADDAAVEPARASRVVLAVGERAVRVGVGVARGPADQRGLAVGLAALREEAPRLVRAEALHAGGVVAAGRVVLGAGVAAALREVAELPVRARRHPVAALERAALPDRREPALLADHDVGVGVVLLAGDAALGAEVAVVVVGALE